MIYLDTAANSKVDKKSLDVFYDACEKYYANPNSIHKVGLEVKEKIDESTSIIAKYLGVKEEEIIYTSGASESNNLAIFGIANKYNGKHIITTKLEHSSIISPLSKLQKEGYDVDFIDTKEDGTIDINTLKDLIRNDTVLISITSVDSELGIKENIVEIGEFLKKNYPKIIFHTDASQSIGKTSFDFKNVDLVTIAPHKFGALNGIGILIKKEGIELEPIIYGGKSTTKYRSGTPNAPMIISLAQTFKNVFDNFEDRSKHIKDLHDYAVNKINDIKGSNINSTINSINNTINFSIRGIVARDVMLKLSEKDIYVSTTSACSSDSTYSRVVFSYTRDEELARSSIRISFNYENTKEELDTFFTVLNDILGEYND